ncbi:hypothetical protein BRSPCE3_67500 [Bradyrhizobium sp. Ce-3]|nr:hypothetical protein BRSPCE3_67500 [Bradyrhizobium sp. Ce-3]
MMIAVAIPAVMIRIKTTIMTATIMAASRAS